MRSIAFIGLFLISFTSCGQIWFENFNDEADGAVTGTATGTPGGTWSILTTPTGGAASFSKQTHVAGVEIFQVNQTVNEGAWQSNIVDISTFGEVGVDLNIYCAGAGTGDYVRAYYKVNGGPEILFGELLGSPLSFTFPVSATISGNTLQIIIRAKENTPGNIVTTFPNAMGFEDIQIADVSTLYSRKTGNWNDVTAGNSTWSSIALGGVSCNCLPSVNTHVIIGNTNTVSITAEAEAIDVTVQGSGILRWTADNVDLNIRRDGDISVDATSVISLNGNAGAQIDFDDNNAHSVTVLGSLIIGDIDVNGAATITLAGSGAISVNDDILIIDNASITNNKTGTALAVSDQINFEGSGADFTNNSILTASTLFYAGDNNSFVNNGTSTISTSLFVTGISEDGNSVTNTSANTLNLFNIELNNGDFIINNSGTVNQSGNFISINNGSVFSNLATGVWNWSLTPNNTFDNSLRFVLFCTASGNTFNYNGAGAQEIVNINYQNLSLSNSGAKDARNQAFSVGGNWLVSGTATFTEGTGTITLNGTGTQTITHPTTETFNNLVINNTFATSPQITLNTSVSVTTMLTMTRGNVNLNGNSFTITSAATGALSHTLASASGWMYGGSIIRSFPNTAIAIGTVDGFFPLGGSLNFRPFFIGKSSIIGSDGTITISHTDATKATDISFTDNTIPASAGTVSIQRRHNSFWTVAKSAGMVTGAFDLRAGGTGFTIGAISDVRLTRVSDATNIGTAVATIGTAADVRANRTGLLPAQLVNNFYIASTNAVASPLPIVLAYYKAQLQGDEVISSWKTLQEKNNHFFTVQKTIDFEIFHEVGTLEGKGTTQEEQAYSFIDDSPFIGKSYYRLKQTDFDGKFAFSEPVMIHYQGSSPVLKAYPNPFGGKHISIELKGLIDIPIVPVHIYNQQGLKIMEMMLHELGPGIIKEEIIFPVNLPPGLYIIKAGKTLQLTRKIVVN